MNLNNFSLEVLVKGKPVSEYLHNGQVFIEGRDGSEFEIVIRNRTPVRAEAIVSVDGLSVIDGKDAGPNSSGYLIDPHGSITIPGWKVDGGTAAKFEFAGKRGSYATQMTGSSRNNGVIGLMVFGQRPRALGYGVAGLRGMNTVGAHPNSPITSAYPLTYSGAHGGGWSNTTRGMANITKGITSAQTYAAVRSSGLVDDRTLGLTAGEQTLGTGFGQATQFQTTEVSFERGDMLATMVLFYDDARGLKARGIQLVRPSRQKYETQPQAFPATGCTPPPGWRG